MSTMIPLEKELPQFEAVALIHEEQPPEPNLIREEAGNNAVDNAFPLEEARRLAQAILRLDGLTGAEIEAAEHVLSVDKADIRRLREIAGNHSLLTHEFFSLNGCAPRAQDNRTNGVGR
jgi:hypothetical protein